MPDEHECALRHRLTAERFREGGLADPRLPADQHQAALAGGSGGKPRTQEGELPVSPDEGRDVRRRVDRRAQLLEMRALVPLLYGKCPPAIRLIHLRAA